MSGKIWLDNQNQNKTKIWLPDISLFFWHKFLILTSLDMERFGENSKLKAKT